MKRFLPVGALLLFSSVPFPVVAASPTEGLTLDQHGEAVVFRVERADSDSIRVQVFDHERDTVLFDSGWSPAGSVEWRPTTEVVRPWRYRVEARDGRGALVLSHTGIRDAGPLQAAPRPLSHGPSVMNIGSAGSTGSLRSFLEGSTVAVSQLGSNAGGGRLRLLDEEGFTITELTSDTHGTGAFFSLSRDQGETGFFVDGNKDGTGEPLMALTGSTRSISFDMSAPTALSSVDLPESSIHSFDIFNEAGAASNNTSGAPSSSTLLSRSIVVPAAGYVLAIGTVEVTTHHFEGGIADSYDVGISLNSTTIPSQQAFTTGFSSSVPDGVFTKVVTVQGIFQVLPAQFNTFRLILDSSGSAIADTRQLSLVFLPTAYGDVAPIASGEAAAAAELAAESWQSEEVVDRIAAEELTRENLERELRVMEQRLEDLERLLEAQGTDHQR